MFYPDPDPTPQETQLLSSLATSAMVSLILALALAGITHACAKAGFDFFRDASPFNAFLLVNAAFVLYKLTFSNTRAASCAIDMWILVYLVAPCLFTAVPYYWNLLFPQ